MTPEFVVSRAPLRISFVGGGSDLPEYYEKFGGAVISTSINIYNTAIVVPSGSFSEIHTAVGSHSSIASGTFSNPLVAATFAHYEQKLPLSVVGIRSITQFGSGLGSSSSFIVALSAAIEKINGIKTHPNSVAESSFHIERARCGYRIGKQDHYAASYGGLHKYEFGSDGRVTVTPIHLNTMFSAELQLSTLIFRLPGLRQAHTILQRQGILLTNEKNTIAKQLSLTALVPHFQAALEAEDLYSAARILDESWQLKRTISPGVTTPQIDEAYASAISAGALGGKVLGAGGGGHLLLIVPKKKQPKVIEMLNSLERVETHWASCGVQATSHYEHTPGKLAAQTSNGGQAYGQG